MLDKLLKRTVKSDCWEWQGYTDKDGYGRVMATRDGKRGCVFAHRLGYELLVGPIPEGLLVLHKCDNPKCWKPEHLFVGTQADNMKDMVQKGRSSVGNQFAAKITEEQAREIVESSLSVRALASKMGISKSAIHDVRKAKTQVGMSVVGKPTDVTVEA